MYANNCTVFIAKYFVSLTHLNNVKDDDNIFRHKCYGLNKSIMAMATYSTGHINDLLAYYPKDINH